MNAIEFSMMLAEWRGRGGFTDAEAAAALGCNYGTFRQWLSGACVPDYFTMVAVVRQMREGRDPLADVRLTAAEFAMMLKGWRAKHGFSQRQAAMAIGCTYGALQGWEKQQHAPRQPALAEIIRRLRMPVDAERVREATKRKRPVEPAEFAARLREWRKRHGLSQAQAGRFLGTTGRTVWVWESMRSLPNQPLAMLAKLAESPQKPRPMITPQRFGRLLRAWRKANGINQAAACRALGLPLDQALISNWERGKAMPRPARLKALLAKIANPLPEPSPKLRFPQLLRDWRKARGINQLAAARVLGVGRDQAKISKWERGKGLPVRPVLVRLLKMLGE
jgi:transcriptional regulator with XRE-family HTH domain